MKDLIIADKIFKSRLFLGTGKFSSNEVMTQAIQASKTELVTAAMKRLDPHKKKEDDMVNDECGFATEYFGGTEC